MTYHYEQPLPEPGGSGTPDPRISHQLTLRVDDYGQPLQTMAVDYPRIGLVNDAGLDGAARGRIQDVQSERHIAYAETRLTDDLIARSTGDAEAAVRHYRLRLPCEVRTFELAGVEPQEGFYYQPRDFAALRLSDYYPLSDETMAEVAMRELPYHRIPDGRSPQRRLVERTRTLYFDDGDDTHAPQSPLPLGLHGPRGLTYEVYKLALTRDLLAAVFQKPTIIPDEPDDLLAWELHPGVTARALLDSQRSGYHIDESTGEYWMRSGIAGFAKDAAQHFFLPERYTDPFGAVTSLEYDPLDLYVRSFTDARRNRTEVFRFDHRVLMPVEMVDANGNHTEVCLDILSQVIAVAAKGKPMGDAWEGDDLDAFHADGSLRNPNRAEVQAFCTTLMLDEAQARRWLSRASSRFVYHFGETRAADGTVTAWATRPAMACAITREIHASQPGGETSPLQVALECSDGSGNVLMNKLQAEPETEGGPLRWIVNGLTVLNNKGKPVKQYEPFFSDRFGCEMPREEGVTPILYYDAAGRVVRTDAPDGTFSRVEFSPWHTTQFDAGDTVRESAWYAERGSPDPTRPLARDIDGRLIATPDVRAAWLAAKLADTPGKTYLDSLGREVIAITHQRTPDQTARPTLEWTVGDWGWKDEYHLTHTKLDAEGKPLWVRDARGNLVMQYLAPPKPNNDQTDDIPADTVPTYDIAGNLLFQHSMDAGDRWSLNDAAGKPFLAWDVNDVLDAEGPPHPEARLAHTEYDSLHRPLKQWLRLGRNPAAVVERFDYRDIADTATGIDLDDARARNFIGQAIIHDDSAGRMELRRRNFTGQVQHEERRLAKHRTARVIDWQGDDAARESQLEAETFTRLTEYDALGRMTQLINWHRRADRVAVYRPVYNARGVLEAEDLTIGAQLEGGRSRGGRSWRAVHGMTYNAKGQRTRLRQGNGTETRYAYDPRSFRLTQLRTTRLATDLPFPTFRSNLRDERVVQQLHYTYDAAGNIVEIEDEAWAPVFFRNQAVEPRSFYVYDALNRLIEATGRESAQLGSRPPGPIAESFHVESFPTDREVRAYRQRYEYDSVGNFIAMRHSADGGGWTREYETAENSNRLLRTWTGGDEIESIHYAYDLHGSMLNLENVSEFSRIRWDWRDMIERMDLGGGGQAWYAYDIGKQRTRKRIERETGAVEERLYLGGAEFFRRYAPSGVLLEEIETHHLFVDDQRVLLVDDVIETDSRTLGTGILLRYQYGNHLGSVALELDATAQIIGCEEFHPYGTTAYHLVNRAVRATAKRYRYTGMERDGETGLSYHTARYYVQWLARWTGCDPKGLADGTNLYQYCRSNPSGHSDRGGTQCDPTITTCPELMGSWSYGESVPDRGSLGVNVQRDHPIQMSLAADIRGGRYTRAVSAAEGELTVLVETGRGRFHTVLGRYQREINARVRSGVISSESELIAATREAYRLAAEQTGTVVNPEALDQALVSRLASLSHRGSSTIAFELEIASGSTTMTSESIDLAFTPAGPPSVPASSSAPVSTSMPVVSAPGLSPRDADVDASTGRVIEGPRTSGAMARRTARTASTSAETPVPSAPVPPSSAAPSLSASERATATVLEWTPRVARVAGAVLTVYGAYNENMRTVEFERRHGRGVLNAALMGLATFIVAVPAGILDDVSAAMETANFGAPVLTVDSYERHDAGRFQHAAGEAIRGFLGWTFALE